MILKSSLLDKLACPLDHKPLTEVSFPKSGLSCSDGHFYSVLDGVPILLPEGVLPTLDAISMARNATMADAPFFLDTVLLSDEEKIGIQRLAERGSKIDPVAAYLVGATNGIAYKHLIGSLDEYPIPHIRLPAGNGRSLLDVGCSWGRWSVSAAKLGYRPIGIDPSLGAVMAARRVCRDLQVEADFVVGDARYLPFRGGVFDQAFSYSVLQHLSVDDATKSFGEIGRILRVGGSSMIQMPTTYGLRCLFNQLRRGFRAPREFEVRYWQIGYLRKAMEQLIGPSNVSVDCFLGIGWQSSDAHLMPFSRRLILRTSQFLTYTASILPALNYVADSVYVQSTKLMSRPELTETTT